LDKIALGKAIMNSAVALNSEPQPKFAAALDKFDSALGLYRKILEEDKPESRETQARTFGELARTHFNIGSTYWRMAQSSMTKEEERQNLVRITKENLEASIRNFEESSKLADRDQSFFTGFMQVATWSYFKQAEISYQERDTKKAIAYASRGSALLKKISSRSPDAGKFTLNNNIDMITFNNSIWFTIVSPDKSYREYEEARNLAEILLSLGDDQLLPLGDDQLLRNSFRLNTLGVAQYRCGDYRAALKNLTESNTLNQGTLIQDLAFMAMASAKLGEFTEAKAAIDRINELTLSPNRKPFEGLMIDPVEEASLTKEAIAVYDRLIRSS
jgi:hypothetical protein